MRGFFYSLISFINLPHNAVCIIIRDTLKTSTGNDDDVTNNNTDNTRANIAEVNFSFKFFIVVLVLIVLQI
jgi:hypothetical protein